MKRVTAILLSFGVAVIATAGCTTYPSQGMTRPALRGDNQSPEEFRADDAACRQYASAQTGFNPGEQAREDQVVSTVAGTVLGTVAGVIGGAAFGVPGTGAGIGAAAGLSSGATGGYGAGATTYQVGVQTWQANYEACMHNEGHRIAAPGGITIQHPSGN